MRCLLSLAALAFLAAPVAAHHSTAAFDLRNPIPIEGVVSKYEWTNPHVYVYLDARTDARKPIKWIVEAGSPAVMRARGWSKDSFTPGESVHMRVYPSRDPAKTVGLVASVQKKDRALAGLLGPAPGDAEPATAHAATGLAGTWVPVPEPSVHQKLRLQPSVLPMTPKGAAALSGFREASGMNPASKCIAPVAPVLMIIPEVKVIEISAAVVRIRSEGFGAERLVHLNVASHEGAARSAQGHSIGRWEGKILVVDTARFEPNRVGNAIGLPSGPDKHLVERFELGPEGRTLKYRFLLEDPEYLQVPVNGELQWAYRPDLTYAAVGCNLQNARQFFGEQ